MMISGGSNGGGGTGGGGDGPGGGGDGVGGGGEGANAKAPAHGALLPLGLAPSVNVIGPETAICVPPVPTGGSLQVLLCSYDRF